VFEKRGVVMVDANRYSEDDLIGAIDAGAASLMRLMDALDEHDDVEAVHANFDIPAELLEQAAA
jgi:transcriptional/translational regulatory protein YebC/TACO1